MKNLLYFLLSISTLSAQEYNDKIVIGTDTIICRITSANAANIVYKHLPIGEKKEITSFKKTTSVVAYYKQGKWVECIVAVITAMPPITPNKITPGDELLRFRGIYYTGATISIVGFSVAALSAYSDNPKKGVVYTGLGVSLVGFIIKLVSFSRAGKAGKLLNRGVTATVNNNGVGVAYRF